MRFFNAYQRRVHIDAAKKATGSSHTGFYDYGWRKFKGSSGATDPTLTLKHNVLMKNVGAIMNDPEYATLQFAYYDHLRQRIYEAPDLSPYLDLIKVVIKGSKAYEFWTKIQEEESGKDMDICIMIDPSCVAFDQVYYRVMTLVHQTLSQHKRSMDATFFPNASSPKFPSIFDCERKEALMRKLYAAIDGIEMEGGKYRSTFGEKGREVFDKVSRHSVLIAHSEATKGDIVIIDVPHYDKCETIPMRRTPFVLSCNETVRFNRSKDKDIYEDKEQEQEQQQQQQQEQEQVSDVLPYVGAFTLCRMKMNVLYTDINTAESSIVSIHIIDVSIPRRDDYELQEFWRASMEQVQIVHDEISYVDGSIIIRTFPTKEMMKAETERALAHYVIPEHKRQRWTERVEVLESFIHPSHSHEMKCVAKANSSE
jgi:hypothetical protein